MSSQYKVKKYLAKIENAPSSDLDRYFEKIRKYKKAQTGGDKPWETYIAEKRKLAGEGDAGLKEAKEALGKRAEEHAKEIGTLGDKIMAFDKSAQEFGQTLRDALEEIWNLGNEIKKGSVDASVLEPITKALEEAKKQTGEKNPAGINVEDEWKQVITKNAPTAPATPPEEPKKPE